MNIDPPELDDPRGIARDVTGMGRWGNGNTSVVLDKFEDIPYAVGLVRQALELQLGEEVEE